jgi:hypothetical protein
MNSQVYENAMNEKKSCGLISPTPIEITYIGCYNDLDCQYNLPLGQMLSDMFHTNRSAVLDTLILTTVLNVYLKWHLCSQQE